MDPVTLIPLAAVAAIALFSGGSKKTKKKKKQAPQQCPPFSIDAEAVAAQVEAAVNAGMSGIDRISIYVGSTLYPKDQNGKVIPWPKSSPWQLPGTTDEPVLCLLGEIKDIVSSLDVPDDDDDPTPGEILTDLIAATPTPGKFSLIKKDQIALGNGGLVAQYLNKVSPGSGSDGQLRLKMLRHMTGNAGDWNYDKYGRTKTTGNWPAYTNNNGRNLGAAFLPRHKNAISDITNGKDPQRNITLTGEKDGPGASYALLWWPPIDKNALTNLGAITSVGLTWDDGSSVLNPPPELLSKLS